MYGACNGCAEGRAQVIYAGFVFVLADARCFVRSWAWFLFFCRCWFPAHAWFGHAVLFVWAGGGNGSFSWFELASKVYDFLHQG